MCNPAFFLRNSVRVPIVPLSFFPSFLYSSEGDGAPPQKIRWHNACVSPPLPALSMDVCMWHMRNLSGSSSQSNHLPQSHDWFIEDKEWDNCCQGSPYSSLRAIHVEWMFRRSFRIAAILCDAWNNAERMKNSQIELNWRLGSWSFWLGGGRAND